MSIFQLVMFNQRFGSFLRFYEVEQFLSYFFNLYKDDFDYPIAGGIKNKIANPKVKERAQDVLEKFFEADYVIRIVTSLDTLKSKDIPEDANWDTIGTYY